MSDAWAALLVGVVFLSGGAVEIGAIAIGIGVALLLKDEQKEETDV
jgi:hypothetical protein